MKRTQTFVLAGRWKTIFVLFAIIVVITLTGLLESRNLRHLQWSFSSIYTDRLVPVTEIFYIADHLYEKRLALEKHLSDVADNSLAAALKSRTHAIDSLVKEYEKTYLIKEEVVYFEDFKKGLNAYARVESDIAMLISRDEQASAVQLFQSQGRARFDDVIRNLHNLARIQSVVGRELMNESNADFAIANLLSHLRFAMVIAVAIFILTLVRTSAHMHFPDQKFRLN